MRRFTSVITAVVVMAAMVVMTAAPVLGQAALTEAGDTVVISKPEQGAAFIDLVPVQACLLDDQGRMFFRVINQGRVWTAPATTTTVTLSTGGAPFRTDFPTDSIPPGGFVDLTLGAGPADLGARVVGFAVTADSTNQVGELDETNNLVGWTCTDKAGGEPATVPSTGGLSPEWLYGMFGAAVVLVSVSFTAAIFGLRRTRA